MAYKFVITLVCFAMANAVLGVPTASVLRSAAPVLTAPAPVLARNVELEEVDSFPQYKYGYDVHDTLSGDSKGHVEERDGDVVRGEYSLIDADGFKRTVTYTADSVNGFNAIVIREPLVASPAPVAPLAAPIVNAAPLTYTSPVVYKNL